MVKTLQWECDGQIPITMSIFKHIEIQWNTLKHTINALKYIKIYYEYIQIHSSTLKYFQIHWNIL
jgi:hypothetical protein